MYQTLKNMLRQSTRRTRKMRHRSNQAPDVEPDIQIRQVIEPSQRKNDIYSNMTDDFYHIGDDLYSNSSSSSSRCSSTPAATTQFDTIAEVHFPENVVAPVTALNMSPKLTSDLMSVSQNMTPNGPSVPIKKAPSETSSRGSADFIKQKSSQTSSNTNSTPSSNPTFEKVADFFHQFSDLRTDVRIMMGNQALVYLLGTNHADPQCPIDVANIIRKVSPQLVIIELCAWRACGCEVHRGNVFQTKPEFTFRYLRKVISQIGFLPAMIFFTDAFNEHNAVTNELLDYGGEFAVAARLCQELGNCKILLGDREIPITVKRQASGMGNWRGIRISILVTLALMFKRRMKPLLLRGHRLVIRDPRFYQIVVLERDIFLTYMIQVASGMKYSVEQPQIVAVVGQGHLNGIQRFWGRILPQILPLILKPEVDF